MTFPPRRRSGRARLSRATPIGDPYQAIKSDIVDAAKTRAGRGSVSGQGSSNKYVALIPTGESAGDLHDYPVIIPALHTQILGIPNAAAGANAGTSPPAPVVDTANSLDTHGTLTFGTGSAPAAGAQVTVTFSTPFRSDQPVPIVVPFWTKSNVNIQLSVTSVSRAGFTFSVASALSASQPNTTYGVGWLALSAALGFVAGDSAQAIEIKPGTKVVLGKLN